MHYFAPGVPCGERAAHEIPQFKRVLSAGPWYCCNSTQGGKTGALIMQSPTDQAPPHSEGWRECPDGLLYLAPMETPTTASLVRSERRMKGCDYQTSSGVTLTIPVAYAAARKVSFSSKKFTGQSDDFGKSAYAFFDLLSLENKGDRPGLSDPRTISLVMLAVQQFYRVTEELLDDLEWISSVDIDPIIAHIMGLSDSKSPAAGASSRSPAAA